MFKQLRRLSRSVYKVSRFSPSHAVFGCYKVCYARGRMEPSHPPTFQPAGAGALLIGTTAGSVGVGALVGWGVGSAAIGALVGAVIGIPAGIFVVYRRYREYLA
jgi:hypothetical protein